MRILYIGNDSTGPVAMKGNPYDEGTLEWNTVVDFACMPEREFTLEESAEYHGVELKYYSETVLKKLEADGIIKIILETV